MEARGRTPSAAFVSPGGEGVEKRLTGPALTRALVDWAGSDSWRLERAATIVLQQATTKPVANTPEAAGYSLVASQLALKGLAASSVPAEEWPVERTDALGVYNDALDVFVTERAEEIAAGVSMSVPTPIGFFKVGVHYPGARHFRAGYFDRIFSADRMEVRGFRHRARVGSFGVALVGERERRPEREKEMDLQPPETGIAVALSGVMRFAPDRNATLEIFDPTRTITVPVDGSSIALAADFTAPFALSFSEINDLWLGIRGLLNVGKFEDLAGIYLTEPIDPNRIPVLLIHGLSSSPLVWRNVYSESMRVPAIREHFQFWYAYYPTGAPLVQSAAWIRDSIREIRTDHDRPFDSVASDDLAIVGYSMGGNIARMLTTNIGDRLWNEISPVPLDALDLDPEDRAEVRNWVFWQAVPGVDVVVFIATPHRGTRMADMSFAHLGSRLVRLPGELVSFQRRVFQAVGDALGGSFAMTRVVTGIDSLSAESPLFTAVNEAPFEPGLRIYSVIGDRGRGDSPNSSDGVVPYSSTHLENAEEEVIVPTGHDAQTNPKAEDLIRRAILSMLPQGERVDRMQQ